ncbi:MAG: ABC transporter substrate-binding protein [Lachnospiraceae bacterium]|nr:ABC transporter substrate-binding protein [Lachnospiraceae bacterium]
MKKTVSMAMALGLAVSAASLCMAEDTIKIALTAPMTGNMAQYGESFDNSVSLACKQWNEKGGVLGQQVEVVLEDTAGDPAQAATVAQKIVSDKDIFAEVGDFNTACCLAAQPIYAGAEMLQVSPTCSAVNFAVGSEWSFECLGTQDVQGEFMAQWAYDNGARKVAVLYLNSDWGISVDNGFANAFKALGGEIIIEEPYNDGETDFSAALTKIRDTEPDALYVACYYNDGAAINIQKDNLGWDIPVYHPGTVYSSDFLSIGGEAVEGVYTNVGFYPNDPTPEAADFIEEYNALFDKDPDYYGACAYDAFNVLMEAIEAAGELDSAKVRDALAATADYEGVSGSITFDENGDAHKSYIKLTVENGEYVVVE